MTMTETFKNFLEFLMKAKDFEIYIVETEEELSDTINFFLSTLNEDADDDKKDDVIDWVVGLNRIIWCTLSLDHKAYNKILSDWQGREFIKNEQFITNVLNEDGTEMMVVQFNRIKTKNIKKTIDELKNELDDAVDKEKYEEASSLKKKIKVLEDKEKKDLEKLKAALKIKNKK